MQRDDDHDEDEHREYGEDGDAAATLPAGAVCLKFPVFVKWLHRSPALDSWSPWSGDASPRRRAMRGDGLVDADGDKKADGFSSTFGRMRLARVSTSR
jgi:hypothetical protein